MDPQEYRDARWHSLLREAEDLGIPEDQAPALVDDVLARQHRRIRRAEDPDPLVRAALHDAVTGPPAREPRRRRWLAVLAAAVVAVGALTTYQALQRPDPGPTDRLRSDQVPSLFGYDGPAAARVLGDRGLRVRLEPFRACEVLGRVLATDPPTGTTYRPGDPITVYTAVPADVACLTDYQDRQAAWGLLDFANGRGPAPRFAHRVFVYSGGDLRAVLSRAEAKDPEDWATSGVLDDLRAASQQVELTASEPLAYAEPALRVLAPTTGAGGGCGRPDPSLAAGGEVFSALIVPPDRHGCGVRLDLRRVDDAIVAVGLYPSP